MKKTALFILLGLTLVFAVLFINRVYNENKQIVFNEMDMRKIAWDSLGAEERKSIVKDDEELKAALEGRKKSNIEDSDVWKYARVEVSKYKNIGTLNLIKMDSDGKSTGLDAITKLENWYKQNYKVVRVSFRTTMDGLLGPITLYIDPDNKRILGSDLRY